MPHFYQKKSSMETFFEEQHALPGVQLITNSSKNNSEITLFANPQNEHTRDTSIAALNQKEDTSVESQHTGIRALFYYYCNTLYS